MKLRIIVSYEVASFLIVQQQELEYFQIYSLEYFLIIVHIYLGFAEKLCLLNSWFPFSHPVMLTILLFLKFLS